MWTKLINVRGTAPTPRSGHTACAVGNRIFIFGGQNPAEQVIFNEVHIFDTDTMTWIKPAAAPSPSAPCPPRNSHTAVVHPFAPYMIVFGGADEEGHRKDTWFLHTETLAWKPMPTSGEDGILAREMHACAMLGRKMIIHGGNSTSGLLGDMHFLDLDSMTWSARIPTPFALCSHSAVTVPSATSASEQDLLIFGGFSGQGFSSDVISLSNGSWKKMRVKGSAPEERFAHSMVLAPFSPADGTKAAIFIIGGINATSDMNDIHVLQLTTPNIPMVPKSGQLALEAPAPAAVSKVEEIPAASAPAE